MAPEFLLRVHGSSPVPGELLSPGQFSAVSRYCNTERCPPQVSETHQRLELDDIQESPESEQTERGKEEPPAPAL